MEYSEANNKNEDYIIASYVIKPRHSLTSAIEAIERYTSISTEKHLDRMLKKLYEICKDKKMTEADDFIKRMKKYCSKVVRPVLLDSSNQFMIEIHVPLISFDMMKDGIPQLLAIFAGNIFRTNHLENVKWVDISFPDKYLSKFPQIIPKFGIRGIKDHLRLTKKRRPLIATNIQPAFGLEVEELEEMCKHIADGGAEIIVEDELLRELPNCGMLKRITHITKALESLQQPKMYFVNALGWSNEIMKKAADIIRNSNEENKYVLTGVIIDPFLTGFSWMKLFSTQVKCPIFAHYYSSGFFTRSNEFGISLSVLSKLAILAGADIIYVGSAPGAHISEDPAILRYVANNLRDTLPVGVYPAIAGGINPGNLIANIKHFGLDTILHVAAGIYGHPRGPKEGIVAFRKLIELISKYCIDCDLKSCGECSNFIKLLKESPEVRSAFQDSLPVPSSS